MKRKILGVLLCLCMVVGLLPTTAFAEGTTTVGIYLRTLKANVDTTTSTESSADYVAIPKDQLEKMGLVNYYSEDHWGNWIDYGTFGTEVALDTFASTSNDYKRDGDTVKAVVNDLRDATVTKTTGITKNISDLNVTWDTLSWSENENGSHSWHLNGELRVCTVTFDLNGGTAAAGTDYTRYCIKGTNVSSGLPANPTREGYTFAGWYTGKTDGTKIDAIPELDSDVTYYAHWTEGHTHCICGAAHSDVGDHTGVNNPTFTKWSSTSDLPETAGNYYLTTDVTLWKFPWVPADGTVLCLNGHSITTEGIDDYAIRVQYGGTFTLTDCSTNGGGSITYNGSGRGGVVVNASCTFNMYGGSITGNNNDTADGSGVYVYSGTFNMYGGSITGNTASYGGGVYITQSDNGTATFTMSGGSITNNTATSKGGGVYVSGGTFTMSGGSITGNRNTGGSGGGVYVTGSGTLNMSGNARIADNENTGSDSYGGGVYVYGTFSMYGGTISGNSASQGGGVYVYGTFSMYGGTISSNSASQGGGVYVSSYGEFTMSDSASISGNRVTGNGGGVYLNGGTLNMSDSASISGNRVTGNGGGVYLNGGTLNMSGNARIADNKNTGSDSYGGGVYVNGSSAAFNMYGGSISGNEVTGIGGGVSVSSGTFNMSGSASISGNKVTNIGGGVYVQTSGTLEMSGNAGICGNTATTNGGGVYLSSGTLKMSGNAGICRNTATNNGGGVYVAYGTFEMSNSASITGNTSSYSNGVPSNVFLSYNQTITIGTGGLTAGDTGAKIGVTTQSAPYEGASITIATGANNEALDYTAIFTPDESYVVTKDGTNLYLSAHQHSWKYEANGATITANCAGCSTTETLTISASDATYDGNAKAATLGSQSGLVSGLKTVEVNYQKKTGDSTYDTATTTAPTNAGTYKASITVGTGESAVTASVVYTIAPKSVTDPTIEVASGSTYDGTEQEPAVTVKDGETGIDSNEYTVVYSNNINAGTATVTVTDNDGGNYTLSEKQQTFEIARRSITVAEASSIADQTYTGSQIKPDVTLTYNGKTLVKDTDYTLTYGDNMTVGSNSGSITFTAKDGGNYTGTKTVNFNIVAKPGQVTISGNLNVTYGTEVPNVTIDKHGSTGDTTVYYYTASNCSAGETTKKPTTAGAYWVKVKMAAAGNYDAAESNVIGFTISKANITPVVSITGWTYKDSANAPSVTGNTGNGSATYAYKVQSAGDDTYSNTVPTAAGDYTVKATVAETTNYNGGSATANFTISPKDIFGVTIADIDAQTYNNGTAITPTPAVKDGDTTLTVGTDFTYGYENNINAGDAAVVKVLGQGNYTGTASKNFTISRADLPITVNITGWVVGGTPNAPSVNGNTGNGTVTYQYKVKGADDSTYTAAVPTAVGDYTVKATVAQTTNYNAASATTDFSISTKAVQTITAENVTVTYGDSDQAVSGTTSGDGTISYTVKSGAEFVEVNSSTGALTIKKVGTATITVSAAETASYVAASKDITVTVNPLAVTAPAADTTVFTYNGQNQTYGVTETANYTVSNGIQKNAGNYTVTVALKDQVNTVWADSNNTTDKTFGFEIKKATITIAAKNKSAYVNDTAPALGEGDYTVSGLVTGESLKTLPAIAYVSTPDMTKAGTVSITVSGAEAPDGGNYNDIIYNNGTLTISTRPSSGGGSYTPPTYKVESEVSKNDDGSVSFSKNNAKKGDTVTITVTPDRYYKVDNVTVKDSSGKEIVVTDNGDGTFTFKMPASKVTVEPVFSWDNPFADVTENAYYTPAVEWALKNDITSGTSATTFSPNAGCTRAQIVTFLWKAAGCPEPADQSNFTDVSADAYYAKAVAWAMEQGITTGTGDGKFSPDAICTRSQSMTFLYHVAGSPEVTDDIAFSDISTDSYYADAVVWAAQNGVTDGTGNNTFSPNADCTRAQIMTFLYRWLVK